MQSSLGSPHVKNVAAFARKAAQKALDKIDALYTNAKEWIEAPHKAKALAESTAEIQEMCKDNCG